MELRGHQARIRSYPVCASEGALGACSLASLVALFLYSTGSDKDCLPASLTVKKSYSFF